MIYSKLNKDVKDQEVWNFYIPKDYKSPDLSGEIVAMYVEVYLTKSQEKIYYTSEDIYNNNIYILAEDRPVTNTTNKTLIQDIKKNLSETYRGYGHIAKRKNLCIRFRMLSKDNTWSNMFVLFRVKHTIKNCGPAIVLREEPFSYTDKPDRLNTNGVIPAIILTIADNLNELCPDGDILAHTYIHILWRLYSPRCKSNLKLSNVFVCAEDNPEIYQNTAPFNHPVKPEDKLSNSFYVIRYIYKLCNRFANNCAEDIDTFTVDLYIGHRYDTKKYIIKLVYNKKLAVFDIISTNLDAGVYRLVGNVKYGLLELISMIALQPLSYDSREDTKLISNLLKD